MPTIAINPVALIAGTLGAPILGNALGRTFITPKDSAGMTDAEANAEFRRLVRNFAIYNGVAALGLGYVSSRKNLSEGWRSAAVGGAIGTGLLAALLGAALVTGPSADAAPQQNPAAPAQFGMGAGVPQRSWTSTFVGYPR